MSRHKIARQRKLGHLIVGYDRPEQVFFCQVWSKAGRMSQSWKAASPDDLFLGIGVCACTPPVGLYDRLMAEVAGKAETNVIVDWTVTPPKETVL